MHSFTKPLRFPIRAIATLALLASSCLILAAEMPAVVDDFSHPQQSLLKLDRMFMNDTVAGGQTTTHHVVADGILSAQGIIVPARGQPGWASIVFLLDAQGGTADASQYQGVRLVVRVKNGNLSVSANSALVTNFDYHAAMVALRPDGAFHEIQIPFSSMKPAWSAATALDPSTLLSLSVVAFDIQKASFEFEIDEIGFY